MKRFADFKGNQWNISINIGAVKRVKSLLGIDLLDIESGDPPLATRLATDVVLLCDVVYCLVKDQADKANITDAQFGEALGGSAIMDMQTAFVEELLDFFRGCGRMDRAKIIEKSAEVITLAVSVKLSSFTEWVSVSE